VLGAALGYAAGFGLAAAWDAARSSPGQTVGVGVLFGPALAAATLILAPLWSAAAGLVPALLAARQDPADILREE
jgi:ABC-type antimicrobial peptide transport system permease subunit